MALVRHIISSGWVGLAQTMKYSHDGGWSGSLKGETYQRTNEFCSLGANDALFGVYQEVRRCGR
jgi:hypothetical protein